MHDVCNLVIKPIIAHVGACCSWSTFVNGSRARPPDIFISHSWSEPFRDFAGTLAILAKERGLTADDVVWICTFANNQFELDLGQDLLRSPFFAALHNVQCSTMALFLDRSATSLSRSWCNFEMAVVTDTAANRDDWAQRRARSSAVSGPALEPPVPISTPSFSNPSGKALVLCTAAGLIGSRRVTSGPVLDALKQLDCCKADASNVADRVSILDFLVHTYLEEPAVVEPGSSLPQRVRGLAPAHSDGQADAVCSALIDAHGAKLEFFNAVMRTECERALELRGLVSGMPRAEAKGRPRTTEGAAVPPSRIAFAHSGLRLHELRDLEARLRSELDTRQPQHGRIEYVEAAGKRGTPLSWHKEAGCVCTNGYHLWPAKTGGERGLMERLFGLAPDATYVEHLAAQPGGRRDGKCEHVEYYVICPWQAPLHEVFSAIEWHAEAHDAPDRATYFVHMLSFGDRRRGQQTDRDAPDDVRQMLAAVGEGVVLVLNQEVSEAWKADSVSLWSLFELWVAEQCRLPLTLACSSGVLATTRPFAGGRWEVGEFDADVAWNMANMHISLDEHRLRARHRSDIDLLLNAIGGGADERDAIKQRASFVQTLNTRLPIRALPSVLRGAAFLDNGSASAKRLSDAIRLLEDLRRVTHVNLSTLRGPYGESPLHVIASRRRLNRPAEPEIADARREMQSLIRIGFDINAQDDEGETPLHWAVFAGAEWCACLLLREGANPEAAVGTLM